MYYVELKFPRDHRSLLPMTSNSTCRPWPSGGLTPVLLEGFPACPTRPSRPTLTILPRKLSSTQTRRRRTPCASTPQDSSAQQSQVQDHTETMFQNSYQNQQESTNQNQAKPGGIIHCCASGVFVLIYDAIGGWLLLIYGRVIKFGTSKLGQPKTASPTLLFSFWP